MSINATLFVQAIVFLILVWFTMKFVWPPIAKALDERAQKIAEGLAAADRAKSELTAANQRVEKELSQARNETASRLADADRNDGHCRRVEKCRSHAGRAGRRREVVSALRTAAKYRIGQNLSAQLGQGAIVAAACSCLVRELTALNRSER